MKNPLPVTTERPSCRPFSFTKYGSSIPDGGIAAALLLFLLLFASGGKALAQGNCYTIICPPDQTNYVCSDTQSVPAHYPVQIITNCTPAPPLAVSCNVPPGTPLGPGVHNIICNYSSGGTPIAQCAFRIFVLIDNQPPVISCPSNIVTAGCQSPTGGCGAVVNYPPPVASDNSGTVTVTCSPASGSFFPCGVTSVTCTAVDRCQRTSACQFTITVQQGGQPPSIQCPSNIVVNTCNNCEVVPYPAPTVVNGTLLGCNPPPTFCFPLGTTTVTCEAANACGTNKCSFSVTVRPVPPVSIQCPTNPIVVTMPCSSNCVPVFYPAPTVSGGTLVSCNPPSGACLPVGLHTVLCTATNDCGQLRECTFDVRVIQGQGQPPTITCPQDIVVSTCSNNCQVVNYPAPSVVNGMLTGCSPASGACFPIGTTTVTCTAVNPCGTNTCSFTITVRDVPPPVITCPSNITVALPCGSNCVPVSYTPTVVNGTLMGCNPPSGTCFPLGLHVVTCRATNICGDLAGCEFTVRVIDGQGHAPGITCPQDITVTTCNTNCQVVNYPAPVVVNGVLVACNPPSGFCFPIGTTAVTCVATNDCGTATCTFKVTVREIPTVSITCPSNVVVTTCNTGEIVNYPAPTVLNGTLVSCNPPSGSFFPVGTNTVTCCAVDQCQRTNCCSFSVIVLRGNPCVKPPLNMVLWLPFDEPVPPIANNIVAGAPNGIHANGPVPLIGQHVLNSLGFDGVNDFVRVPNYGAIVLSAQHFSIDAWVRRGTGDKGRRVIVSKLRNVAGALGPRGYEYYLNNGVMNLFLGGPVAQNFNSGVLVPLDGNWHHVTVTVQRGANGAVRFYLDGVQVNAQFGAITAPIGNTSPLFVGAGTHPVPNSFFRGHIDEVEIFNRVLAPAEIFGLWNAGKAGKCKIKCSIPWDKPFPPNVNCMTVTAMICNQSGVPQTINWSASGPMPFPTPNGSFTLPPFTCTNVPITICRPTNGQPVGAVVQWTLSVSTGTQCPMVCVGSVINPGPIVVTNPDVPVGIAGTNRPATVRIGLNGLPPGQPIRLRGIGPDMEPDQRVLSLNGLPPGTPVIIGGGGGFFPAADYSVDVRYTEIEPIGLYTILIEADLDGDGDFDTLSSFDVQNTIVPPTSIRIVRDALGAYLEWDDLGDGYGTLETSDSVLGPWTPIPGALPPYRINLNKPASFFDVFVDYE